MNDPSETSGGPLASDVVFVGVVDLLDAPVAEGQLPHPVHAAPHARRQAQVSAGRRGWEAICSKVIRAI